VFYSFLPAYLKIQEGVAQVGFMGGVRRALRNVLGAEGWLLILGIVFIVVTLFMPEGIVGAWRKILGGRKKANPPADEPVPRAVNVRATSQVEVPV